MRHPKKSRRVVSNGGPGKFIPDGYSLLNTKALHVRISSHLSVNVCSPLQDHGCVLVIDLSAHLQRVYSVSPIYKTMSEAKRQCSLLAVKQGVVDFIKFGNGQTAPAQASDELLDQVTAKREFPTSDKKGRAEAITLQSFFDTLPKPFPEPVGDRPISEFNVPGMLNNTLQLAKGAKLSIQFYFLSDSGSRSPLPNFEPLADSLV